jgi:hypothetical protein
MRFAIALLWSFAQTRALLDYRTRSSGIGAGLEDFNYAEHAQAAREIAT